MNTQDLKLIGRAVKIIATEAETIKRSHSPWSDDKDGKKQKATYDRYLRELRDLRDMASRLKGQLALVARVAEANES